MPEVQAGTHVRPLDELDLGAVTKIDERISGQYRPEVWEQRVAYYLRRDPEASKVIEKDGSVVGFMMADVREGEFGLEEPSGWIERFGIDPDHRGRDLGKQMFDAVTSHFREQGIGTVRTLVDTDEKAIAGFLSALGFEPSKLQALEMKLTNS